MIHPLLRSMLLTALVLASLDVRAKTDKPCVTTLEARTLRAGIATAPDAKPKPGCPVAVGSLSHAPRTGERRIARIGTMRVRHA